MKYCNYAARNITPVLHDLQRLPVDMRVVYTVLFYAYKLLHDNAPPYICEIIEMYKTTRSLKSNS